MAMCFYVFGWKISFLGKIGKKFGKNNQNFLVPVIVSRWTNSNNLNGMVMFAFLSLDGKYPALVILVQKIKNFCLR